MKPSKETLAFAWHLLDSLVAVVGIGWSFYHWRKQRLITLPPR